MDWYVLQVRTDTEHDTRHTLERAGFDARVPTERRPVHRRGAWLEQEYTLLPGYVFISMDFTPECYQRIRRALGSARLLGMQGEAPTPIAEAEAALWGLSAPPALLVPSVIEFDANGTPRVMSGPLIGREGQITRIDRHARRAYVAAQLPGGSTKLVRFGVTIAQQDGAKQGGGS